MKITRLKLENFRSFAGAHDFELENVNVFIGRNNAGKSSILRALYTLQDGQQLGNDVRVGTGISRIHMDIKDIYAPPPWPNVTHENGLLEVEIADSGQINMELLAANGSSHTGLGRFTPRDPHHFIVPYLSRRKTALYQENVNVEQATSVQADFSNLAAKLSRLGNPSYPAHQRYDQTCRAILGFTVTAVPSNNGQRPGIYLPNRETLGLEQMGDGVPNIVGLLADLAQSEEKLFLIEEPENDLHPHALKACWNSFLRVARATRSWFRPTQTLSLVILELHLKASFITSLRCRTECPQSLSYQSSTLNPKLAFRYLESLAMSFLTLISGRAGSYLRSHPPSESFATI